MTRARRGRGEGSIFQRKDGRWQAAITVGCDANGKRKRQTVYGLTKQETQEKLTALQGRKLDGSLSDRGRLTVAAFLDRWLEDVSKPAVRATTYSNYKAAVENHVKPMLGGMSLAKLGPAHIQGFYAHLEREKVGVHARRLVHAVLRKAFKQAVRWGEIPRNPCEAVDPPRIERAQIKPLDAEQAVRLLSVAKGDRLEALYVLAIGTGMRLGELFGLQWEDVDLPGKAVTVRHAMTELNGMLTLSEPKTEKSRRRIELPQKVVIALQSHRKRMLAEGNADVTWVFCNSLGGPLRRSHFHRQDFKPLLRRAKLPDIRFHDLRHSHATLLLSEGVHPKVVQERLGHSQIGMTMDTYSHVLPTMQKEAAGRLDRLLATAAKVRRKTLAG